MLKPSAGKNKFLLLSVICYLLSVFLSGCALTGPYVSEEEIRRAGTELKVKALKFQIDYLVKVNNIGYKLLLKLPEEDKKKDFVYSGLLLSKIDEYFVKLYHLSNSNGVVVTGVVEGSPAKMAGVIAGDVIKSIENLPINDLSDSAYVLNHKSPGQLVELAVLRS